MSFINRKRQSAFTLIEMLVAVAVIAILTGLGLASYRRFDSNRKVEASAVGFGSFLRTSQKRADAGEIRSGWCTSVEGHLVHTFDNTSNAEEKIVCGGGWYDPETFTLVYNSKFTNDTLKVIFLTYGRGVEVFPAHEFTKIVRDGSDDEYKVAVDIGGAITVEKI